MSTKLEYLKLVTQDGGPFLSKRWYITAFSIPVNPPTNPDISLYSNLSVVPMPDGYHFVKEVDGVKVLEAITDAKNIQLPLFEFQSTIDIDESWVYSLPKTQTKIGNLCIHMLAIHPVIGDRLGFLNGPLTVKQIENRLASKLKSDSEATDSDISVSQLVKCLDRLTFLESLANIINIAASVKAITPPTGIKEAKKKLLEEYAAFMGDPIKVVELEGKLEAIDKAYLEGDKPSRNIFNKKSRTARKKMYLMVGETLGFDKNNPVITKSLSEGIDTSESGFTGHMDDTRTGSFFRGSSTQKSGVIYKLLQRAMSTIVISDEPCDTDRGYKRSIGETNYSKLISRYVKKGNDWVLISNAEQAKEMIGKIVEIRSTMYCTSEGNSVCYKCLGEIYKGTPTAMTNIVSELSGVLMATFLKRTHGVVLETETIQIADLVT